MDGKSYGLNLTRFRLQGQGEYSRLRSEWVYDHQFFSGTYLETLDYRSFGRRERRSFWDLEHEIAHKAQWSWRHRLHRAWLGWEASSGVLRLGRQRLGWGVQKFWSPTDVVNPFQPTSLERSERLGSDLAYGRYDLGNLSSAELAYLPQDRWRESLLLGRYRAHGRGIDFSGLAGKIPGEASAILIGGDAVLEFFEGQLRGEAAYHNRVLSDHFFRYALGYEYAFSSSPPFRWMKDLWLTGEYYHNGRGRRDVRQYDFAALSDGRETAVARNYLGLGMGRDLHPLLRLETHSVLNLTDGSFFVSPSMSWNVWSELNLLGGIQIFSGDSQDEFGRLHNLPYVQLELFF